MRTAIPNDILLAALAGFKLEQERLEEKIAQVQALLDGGTVGKPASVANEPAGKRKKRSPAVRRRMAEAQKARWAKLKGESNPIVEAPEPPKAKRKLSTAGRNAIVAAAKKRWALKKAAAGAKKTASPKKTAKKTTAKKAAKPKKKTAQVPVVATDAGQ